MRWYWLIPAGALASALALFTSAQVLPSGAEPLAQRLEVARLRAHFDSVDVELRSRDVLQLSSGQRTARLTLIAWLREYRDAGSFPQNDRFPGREVPFFRDSRDVLCAMAYLIERSGRGDLVDGVAATRNNAYIAELADNPALLGWLDSTGLTVAEAARIQPGYGCCIVVEDDRVTAGYAITSIVLSGASLASVGLNLIDPSRSTGWAGVIAGSAGFIAGAANLDRTGGTDDVAAANMIIGSGAVAAGLYRLLTPGPGRPADGLARQPAGSSSRVAITPVLMPAAGRPRLGLAMHGSF